MGGLYVRLLVRAKVIILFAFSARSSHSALYLRPANEPSLQVYFNKIKGNCLNITNIYKLKNQLGFKNEHYRKKKKPEDV